MKKSIQKIFLIPHFHYDVVYSKTFEEYLDISFANLIEMLNIMDKCPQYKFLIESVILLQEFWDRFPEHQAKLQQLAKEGRIEVVPAMYVVPDMNLVSGEFLIRQIEVGKTWVKEVLALNPGTCWIADGWGHHAQLPQILKGCGYDYYAFSRAMRLDVTDRSEFFWRGLDGTQILTHWMPIGYNGFTFHGYTYKKGDEEARQYGSLGTPPLEFDLKKMAERLKKLSQHATVEVVLLPDGTDFGRPQLDASEGVSRWNQKHPDQKAGFSLTGDFFTALEKRKKQIPVVSADFNPAFQGTYCSRISIKQENRFLENQIDIVERLLGCLSLSGVDEDNLETEVERATILMLYNQFHDTICGSIIDEANEDTERKYMEARRLLSKAIHICLDKVFHLGNTPGAEPAIMIFNSMAKPRNDIAEARISFSQDDVSGIRIFDDKGKEIPCQIISRESVLRHDTPHNKGFSLIFPAKVPALGYKTYRIEFTGKKKVYKSSLSAKGDVVENRFYCLKLSESGTIQSLIHKDTGEEFVNPKRPYFNDLCFQVDQGDFWEYYKAPVNGGLRTTREYADPYPIEKVDRSRAAVFTHQRPQQVEILEKGPARMTVRVTGEVGFWGTTWAYVQYIYLYDQVKRIDFQTELLPAGKQYRVRACFPTNIKNGRSRYEIPFGIQERPEGEYPAINWMDYSDKKKGLCLINRGIPGNNVTDGVMMLSLFRAVDMGPGKYKSDSAHAIGKWQRFEYSLVPFMAGDKEYRPYLCGREINQPLVSRSGSLSRGKVLSKSSFFSLSPGNVVLSLLKKFRNGMLIRFYEAEGKKSNFELRIPSSFSDIYETDCLGQNRVKLELSRTRTLKGTINRFEIKTFWLRCK